ncbi:MAG: glycosyltransferase [Planctomycetes bacterium]|nr:glycosyltransferase [Planctomycetota bacterium]MBL7041363.1 glycosyltransferase [Pirellulaceae bacterium]
MSSQSLCFLFVGYLEGGGAQYLHGLTAELGRLGHRVEFLAIDNPNPNPVYGVLRCTPWQFGRVGRSILERQLFSTIRRAGVDVVLVYSPNRFIRASTLAKLRKRGVTSVLWEDDLALREGFQVEAAAEFDLIVVTDSYAVPFLENVLGHPHVHVLQGCAMPGAYPVQNLTAEQREEFGAEVSFIGKYFPHRERFFQSLARPVRIWGPDWQEESALPDRADIVSLDPKDKSLVYAASKINLHLRAGHQQVNGFSSRIYEVPLCGGFILAEATQDLVDCFDVDREIAVFRTAEEARGKIEFFLGNEDARTQMSDRLRARILKDYTLEKTVARFQNLLIPIVRRSS